MMAWTWSGFMFFLLRYSIVFARNVFRSSGVTFGFSLHSIIRCLSSVNMLPFLVPRMLMLMPSV